MGSSSSCVALALSLALLFTVLELSCAQNPQDYLPPHNAARRRVRVGPMRWNATLGPYVRSRAAMCARRNVSSRFGENDFLGPRSITPTQVVNRWAAERRFYIYATNRCVRGRECRHYTQVVWRRSTSLWCARNNNCPRGMAYTVCAYFPRGNIPGQRPY